MESFFKELLYLIFLMNLIGFIIMYVDKQRAIKHKWRISENKLLTIAFLFGSLGMLLGMNTLRHKTKHLKFEILVPLFLVLQVIAVVYLFML